jgi:putative phage-type endonuclease
MRIIDCEQGSLEWRMYRAGKVGSSMVADVTARLKSGGWGASRTTLMDQLVAERLTGRLTESFTSPAMKWGTDTEPEAREAYEMMMGLSVERVGLVLHPNIDGGVASPDGLVGSDGLVEIKCPNTSTHISTLRGASIDGGYVKQMQWQMGCTGRRWCDFVSYDPRMPEEMQLHVRRVERDDEMIRQLDSDVAAFLRELDETVIKLVAAYRQPMAAE